MITLPILIPLLSALLIGLCGRWPNLREAMSVLGGVATAFAAIALQSETNAHFLLSDFGAGISLYWEVEPLGLLFALVAGVLWPVTAIYAAGYLRGAGEKNQTRFFIFMAVSIAAAQCIALAGNLFTLFVGYEALTLATWPLVTHKGNEAARQGGRTYLGYLLPSSVALLLPAIIIVQQTAGSGRFIPGGLLAGSHLSPIALGLLYAMFLFGIGKAALMPLHRWLPAAMVAPTPVSALLHAVAVVKAGVFCVLKITLYVFGIDLLSSSGAAQPMLWLAAFSLLAASFVALYADNLKRRLAYSTVSQLAYVVLGATLASQMAAAGATLHIMMHAFGKITLFFCAGAIYVASHRTLVSELNGLGRSMPFTFAAFAIAALSIIGLPPTGGTWSKWLLMSAAQDAGMSILLGVLALSSLLNLVYLLDIPLRGFLRAPQDATSSGFKEAPLACTLPLVFTASCCLVLFLMPDLLLALFSPGG